jgi:hypothetical protein
MQLISEYFNLDPKIVFVVIVVAVLTVFVLVVKWLVSRTRDDSLYDDLGDERDEDESDESEEEKPKGRFFVIESYYLPDDWEETFDVIVDRQTKVQYLRYEDYGITPLIDADGKPILYKDKYQEESE